MENRGARSTIHPATFNRVCDAALVVRAQQGDRSARDVVIRRHDVLIARIAAQYRAGGFPDEDLRQAGALGLLEAIDRFDPRRGVPFSRYAGTVIRGEIQHLLRDKGWLVRPPRSLQEIGRHAVAVRERLAQRLGRPPRDSELAEALGVPESEVTEALVARNGYRAASTERDDDEAEPLPVLARIDSSFALVEDRSALGWALARLPWRQRRIIRLSIWEEWPQREIARELGISQMHVSRLRRQAITRLRVLIDGQTSG